MKDDDVNDAIERGKRKSAVLEIERVRLRSTIRGLYAQSDFSTVAVIVGKELSLLASELGADEREGWIG